MQISGTIECEYCNSTIEWEYLFTQNINSQLQIFRIDKSKSRPTLKIRKSDTEFVFEVLCKNCYSYNMFEYSIEEKS